MNKILEKIARELPLRPRVEVIIIKDGKVLVTENTEKGSGRRWIGLPGGGVDNNTEEDACKNESLEEVGVRIKNVKSLGYSHVSLGMTRKENRHLQYSGARTNWYVAEYDDIDKSKYGNAGDAAHFSWRTPDEALKLFKAQKKVYPGGIKAMKTVKEALLK